MHTRLLTNIYFKYKCLQKSQGMLFYNKRKQSHTHQTCVNMYPQNIKITLVGLFFYRKYYYLIWVNIQT